MEPAFDPTKPHAARMYDYLLGGHDHFPIDRETAEKALAAVPTGRGSARENRAFLGRAVRYLATEAGIRQFLDIGSGLPSANNVHEVVQAADPRARVVYVDNDPAVLAHARTLLTSTPEGRTAYLEADLREPERILADPVTTGTLDLTQPTALILVGILHFMPDDTDPGAIIATLMGGLPPGSYLALSHGTPEYNAKAAADWTRTYREGGVPFQLRSTPEVTEMAFRGLELVEPGLVGVPDWRPDGDGPRAVAAEVGILGGVARKP